MWDRIGPLMPTDPVPGWRWADIDWPCRWTPSPPPCALQTVGLNQPVSVGPGMLADMTIPTAAELVLRTAEKHGVPGPVAQELLAGSRPCVHLVPFQDLTPVQQQEPQPLAVTWRLPASCSDDNSAECNGPRRINAECHDMGVYRRGITMLYWVRIPIRRPPPTQSR